MKILRLAVFKIFSSTAVGAFCIYWLLQLYFNFMLFEEVHDLFLVVISIFMGLGVYAAFTHSGNAAQVWLSLNKLRSSWITRTLILASIFMVLTLLLSILNLSKINSNILFGLIICLGVIIGILLIYSLSRAYTIRTDQIWSSKLTVFSFYFSSALLGLLLLTVVFLFSFINHPGLDEIFYRLMFWLGLLVLLILGVKIFTMPYWIIKLSQRLSTINDLSPKQVKRLSAFFGLNAILVFMGVGLIIIFMYLNTQTYRQNTVYFLSIFVSFLIIMASEIVGSYLYYWIQLEGGRLSNKNEQIEFAK